MKPRSGTNYWTKLSVMLVLGYSLSLPVLFLPLLTWKTIKLFLVEEPEVAPSS